ncbi:MAG TPA: hypothetical protein VH166_09985 [Mycobacterium sp.]|jgi:hypothetical protein|nr:hypothetical protein [Mycobacterium sp.]
MTTSLQAPPARTTPDNGLRYVALALGILSLITSVLLVGLLFGSLAVTLGLASLDAARGDERRHRKSAIAAVVLGVVAIVISLAALVFKIWMIAQY